MDFYIKQNATLPLLKIKVSKDGRSDFGNFMSSISSSTIYYSLTEVDTGILKVVNKYVDYVVNDSPNGVSPTEIFLYIQLSHKITKTTGKFKIQFFIETNQGVISLPLTDDIFVIVTPSFIADDLSFSNSFVINDPCCFKIINIDNVNYLITENGDKIMTEDGYFIIVIV